MGVIAMVMLLIGAGTTSASAKRLQKVPAKIAIDVTVIEASQGGAMDPRLKALARELRRSFSKHTGFALKQRLQLKLPKAKSVAKRLNVGKVLALTYLGVAGRMLRVQLSFDGAQSVMKVRDGGFWFYARRLRGKKALILALRARVVR